MKFMPKPLLFL